MITARLKAAVVVLVGVGTTFAMGAAPASAGQAQWRVWDHNVAHIYGGALEYRIDIGDIPGTIALQEMCQKASDWDDLNDRFSTHGFLGDKNTVDWSFSCGNKYTVAMSRGANVSVLLNQDFTQNYSGENHGFVCVTGYYLLLSWHICSTHLTAKSTAINNNQATEMRNVATFISDRAVMVGGDLNQTPSQPAAAPWYASWYESDQTYNTLTYKNPSPRTKKLDYVFSNKSHTNAGYGVAEVICGSTATGSDHCVNYSRTFLVW